MKACIYFGFFFVLQLWEQEKERKQTVTTEKGGKLFLSLDVVQLVFKEHLEVWPKLYGKLLYVPFI